MPVFLVSGDMPYVTSARVLCKIYSTLIPFLILSKVRILVDISNAN